MAEQIRKANKMPKIGIDGRGAIWYRGTGIGTYTYQLTHQLHQRLCPESLRIFLPGEEYQKVRFGSRADFIPLEQKGYWANDYLPNTIEKEGIQLYHVPQNGIGLPAAKKCKQVVTVHDLIPYVYPETVGKSYLRDFLREMPRIMEQADGVIAVSQQSKADIIRYFQYPADKIKVIYEAAEPVYGFTSKAHCKQVLAQSYGIRQDYILYVGGFGPRKNLRALLVAYAQAIKELPNQPLLVCPGKWQKEGDYLEEIMSALGILGQVVFPGFVPLERLPYFYGGAQVFVYPSLYEGFGLPVLEAMACGCPVIAGNNSSLPEVAGEAGLLVNALDTLAIAEAICQVCSEPERAEKMSLAGLKQAAEFSWEKNAAQTIDFYQQILA